MPQTHQLKNDVFFAALAIKTDLETLPRAPEARAEKIWRFRSRKVGKLAIFALKRSLFWDFPVKCQIHYFQIFPNRPNSLSNSLAHPPPPPLNVRGTSNPSTRENAHGGDIRASFDPGGGFIATNADKVPIVNLCHVYKTPYEINIEKRGKRKSKYCSHKF